MGYTRACRSHNLVPSSVTSRNPRDLLCILTFRVHASCHLVQTSRNQRRLLLLLAYKVHELSCHHFSMGVHNRLAVPHTQQGMLVPLYVYRIGPRGPISLRREGVYSSCIVGTTFHYNNQQCNNQTRTRRI